jgi:hypothetical protein
MLPLRVRARAVGQQRPCLSGRWPEGENDPENGTIPLAPLLKESGVG